MRCCAARACFGAPVRLVSRGVGRRLPVVPPPVRGVNRGPVRVRWWLLLGAVVLVGLGATLVAQRHRLVQTRMVVEEGSLGIGLGV